MQKPLAKYANQKDFALCLERVRQGEAGASHQLVVAALPLVHGLLYRLGARRHELDDLSQNVFLKCFASLPTFRGDSAFTTWLGGICVNTLSEHWRVRKRDSMHNPLHEGELHLAAAPSQQSDMVIAAREGLRAVHAILLRLKPKHRVSFVLHVLEELDVPTVAAMTNESVAATYKNIHRARLMLESEAAKNSALRKFLDHGGAQP